MFASRLGSLSTVFTWLRSRACAGMQGLGVLALVVVAPCGFAAHVALEEAVLSSPRNRCGRRKLRSRGFGSGGVGGRGTGPRDGAFRNLRPPPHRVSFKKNHFSCFCTR